MSITINGTTGIAGVDGTASAPSVQGADANTGVFFPAADTVAVTTGGTERMRVDSSGNVGIGTNNPQRRLDVSSSSSAMARFFGNNANNYIELSDNNGSAAATIGSIGGGNIYTYSAGYNAMYAGGSERLRIDTAGAFGIGGANYGTSGQVLTSGGSGAAPSWASSQSIGVGQTWQTVSRAASTSYQNTTGRPLEVAIDASNATARAVEVSVDNATWLSVGGVGTTRMGNQFIVPNNWYYRINGSVTLNAWTELR